MKSTLMTNSSPPSDFVLVIGLAVAFLAYYLAPILRWLGSEFGSGGPEMSIFWKVVAAVMIIGFVWLIEKRRLVSVNIKPPSEQDITWAFYLWGLSMAWYWIISTILPPTQSEGINTIANLHPLIVRRLATNELRSFHAGHDMPVVDRLDLASQPEVADVPAKYRHLLR